jgi:hypothetical protein
VRSQRLGGLKLEIARRDFFFNLNDPLHRRKTSKRSAAGFASGASGGYASRPHIME